MSILLDSVWHLSIMSLRSVRLEPCRIVQGHNLTTGALPTGPPLSAKQRSYPHSGSGCTYPTPSIDSQACLAGARAELLAAGVQRRRGQRQAPQRPGTSSPIDLRALLYHTIPGLHASVIQRILMMMMMNDNALVNETLNAKPSF